MFTGLVIGMGRIDDADNRGAETRYRISPLFALPDTEQGESIAVNGVCLTVETFGDGWFTCYASRETLSVSSLGGLRVGSTVNLERAMAMGDRFGGHIVAGHVDCLAEVVEVRPAGQSNIYRLAFDAAHGKYVIPKGSVTLDGISLTVNQCAPTWLEVNIIPETRKATTIAGWTPGTKVNMETDLIGKYVERMVTPWMSGEQAGTKTGITMEYLRQHGFQIPGINGNDTPSDVLFFVARIGPIAVQCNETIYLLAAHRRIQHDHDHLSRHSDRRYRRLVENVRKSGGTRLGMPHPLLQHLGAQPHRRQGVVLVRRLLHSGGQHHPVPVALLCRGQKNSASPSPSAQDCACSPLSSTPFSDSVTPSTSADQGLRGAVIRRPMQLRSALDETDTVMTPRRERHMLRHNHAPDLEQIKINEKKRPHPPSAA